MRVQKILIRNDQPRYLLLDNDGQIIEPVRLYLKYLDGRGCSIFTLRTYCFHLKLFFEFLQAHRLDYLMINKKGKRVLLLTEFMGFLRQWQGDNVLSLHVKRKNKTINDIMSTVIGFYRFLALNGEVSIPESLMEQSSRGYRSFLSELMPYKRIKRSYFRLKEEQHEVEVCSRTDVMTLIQACDTLRDKLLISIMYEAGLRLGEALNLWVKDFKVWENRIHIQQHEGANPFARVKNQNEGILDIPQEVMRLFCRYMADEYPGKDYQYVFLNLRGKHIGEPLKAATVEAKFQQLGGKVTGIRIHPHVLRHSHATELIEIGNWDVLDVQTRLRHRHVQTTIQSYIRLSDDYKLQKFREFYERVKSREKNLGW